MKVLIIDRDEAHSSLMRSKIEGLGHQVFQETVKNDAVDYVAREECDVIFLDPSPLTNARPLIMNIRRAMNNYPYIVLMGEEEDHENFIKAGANGYIQKPADPAKIEPLLENARRLTNRVQLLGDDSLDFPSAGGIISKSAFNQLFLSSIDRADRYGEDTFVVFITIENYFDMMEKDGPYYADYAVAKISQHLAYIRRQSDIIGQTGKNEYALLLLRPQYDTEPLDAANRFADELSRLGSIKQTVESDPEIRVRLIKLPTSEKVADHAINLESSAM